MPSKRDGYGTLLIGEFIGLILGGSAVLGAAGALNPYIALSLVLSALVWHLTVRKALRG
jgi:hypothetical protein